MNQELMKFDQAIILGGINKNMDHFPPGSVKMEKPHCKEVPQRSWFVSFVMFPFQLMALMPRADTEFGRWIRGPFWHINYRFKIEEFPLMPYPSNTDAIFTKENS